MILYDWCSVSGFAIAPFNHRSTFKLSSIKDSHNRNTYSSSLSDRPASCLPAALPLPLLTSDTIITSLYIKRYQ